MNKILMARDGIILNNYEGKINNNIHKITINGKCILKLENILNLDLFLNNNSYLDVSIINNNSKSSHINIHQENKTVLKYKEVIINNSNPLYEINNYVNGDHNNSILKIRCLNKNGLSKLNVLANVFEKTSDNQVIEDLKGLIELGSIQINPDLEVSSFEGIVNHLTSISSFDKEKLLYLKEKGISLGKAKLILEKGFLKGIFDEEVRKELE